MNSLQEKSKLTLNSGTILSAIHSMGARVLVVLLNAATGMLTARALHPVGRGELAALTMWPMFLGSAMSLGLPSALIFYSRRPGMNRSNLFWTASLIAAAAGMLVSVLGILALPVWLANYQTHTIVTAQYLMLSTPVVIFMLVARAACESRSDFGGSSLALLLTPLISLVLLLSFSLFARLTPTLAAIAYVIGGVPVCVWLYVRNAIVLGLPASNFFSAAKPLLRYGIRAYGADVCGTLSLYADQVLVVRLLSAEMMAIYVVALSLSRMLNVIHTSVAAVLLPKAVDLEAEDLLRVTGRAVRTSTLLTALCGLVLAVLSPVVLPFLYGPDYRGVSAVLNILVAEVVLTGATLVLTQAFMALGRPGLVTILQSAGILVSLPLLILLVPQFGTFGAATALLLASFIRLLLTIGSFRWILRMTPPAVIPQIGELRSVVQQAWATLNSCLGQPPSLAVHSQKTTGD